jgi:hypothetical protein
VKIGSMFVLALAATVAAAPLQAQGNTGAQTVPNANAQDQPANDLPIVLAQMKADKKSLVAQNMPLTQGQADAFWPVYDAYQADLGALTDRTIALINNYATNYNTMTDDVAGSLATSMVQIEQDRVQLMRSYLPKFQKVLPPKLVARYYQIENKLRAALMYSLAADIPLVQ